MLIKIENREIWIDKIRARIAAIEATRERLDEYFRDEWIKPKKFLGITYRGARDIKDMPSIIFDGDKWSFTQLYPSTSGTIALHKLLNMKLALETEGTSDIMLSIEDLELIE